jgi:hypothetical protein
MNARCAGADYEAWISIESVYSVFMVFQFRVVATAPNCFSKNALLSFVFP